MSLGQGIYTVDGNTVGTDAATNNIKITINTSGAFNSFLAGILASTGAGSFTIQNNKIGGISIAGSTTAGGIIPQWIQVQGTPSQTTTVSNNLIGSTTVANSISYTVAANVISFNFRYIGTTAAAVNFTGNTIQNVTDNSTGTGSLHFGILFTSTVGSSGVATISNNTIRNLSHNGTTAAPALGLFGIALQNLAGTTHSINNNTIANLSSVNVGAFQNYVVGIQAQGQSFGGTMYQNKIYGLSNNNTGAVLGLSGIYINSGLNWSVNNNQISISNGVNTNAVDISGITEFMAQNAIFNANFNSIYVGGTSSGTINTIAYNHGGNATVSLKNNLLYNERTGGTGNHVAIASSSATPSLGWNVSNNNAFVTADASKVGLWGATLNNFATWKINSGTDVNSITDLNTVVTSPALFVSTTTGDLHINTSTFPVGYGTPIASITTDFDGDLRSLINPTIGSDEKACVVNNAVTELGGVLTATQTGATYQWYECPNTLLVGEISQTYTPTVVGDYKVVITLGGCSATSACTTVNTLGRNNFELNSKFIIYPNPTSGIVNVKSDFDNDFIIVNQLGQTVKTFKVTANIVNTINVENLSQGVYFVKGTDGTKFGSQKLIIK